MELQEFLDQEENVNEGFKVKDDQEANWALRKIKQYQDKKSDNNALAQAEIDKIEAWNQQENDKAQQSIDYFQGLLAEYAMKKREEDPKFKSMKLPHGFIRYRKVQPKLNYSEDILIDHLEKNNRTDLIKIKKTINKSEIKKAFSIVNGKLVDPETGEFVKGVEVLRQGEKFEVKVE